MEERKTFSSNSEESSYFGRTVSKRIQIGVRTHNLSHIMSIFLVMQRICVPICYVQRERRERGEREREREKRERRGEEKGCVQNQ